MPHKIRKDSSNKPLFYFGKDLIITASQTKIESSEELLNFYQNQNSLIKILPEFNFQNNITLPQGNFYILTLKIINKFQDSKKI